MTSEIIAGIIAIIIIVVSIDVMTQKDMSGKFEGFTLYLIIKDAIADHKIKRQKENNFKKGVDNLFFLWYTIVTKNKGGNKNDKSYRQIRI